MALREVVAIATRGRGVAGPVSRPVVITPDGDLVEVAEGATVARLLLESSRFGRCCPLTPS